MTDIGEQLADRWMLRSGHANGADMAFEAGHWLHAGRTCTKPNIEIFLPWNGFNAALISQHYHLVDNSAEAMRIASMFHPAWDRCNEYARALHTRNVPQVIGNQLDTPSDMVICWTPEGKIVGGTATALRIAEYLNIPIFNLALEGTAERLCAFVQEKERAAAEATTAIAS